MNRAIQNRPSRLTSAIGVHREERRLAGLFGGALFMLGALVLVAFTVLPGIPHQHDDVLLALAGISVLFALCAFFLIDWLRSPGWAILPVSVLGLGLIGAAIASSGGAGSPAWVYLFFPVVLAAYFFRPPAAYAFAFACVATHATVLIYDGRAVHEEFLAEFAVAAVAYLMLTGAIVAGKRRMWELRRRSERLADEQGALRRVATAVVSGEPPSRIYARVAFEAAALVRAGAAGVLKLEGSATTVVTGSWADRPGGRYEPGTVVPIVAGGDIARALETGRPVRIDVHAPDSPVSALGYTASVVAPIRVSGAIWGVLAVAGCEPAGFKPTDEYHLMEFGDLLATAIGNLEDRAKLASQASSDPLTGLANHRTLQKRLSAEIARAIRHDVPLSVAVIDIDHFKVINDSAGHETGDEMLIGVAECLSEIARTEDTLARLGGDEFAWLLPETTREQALVAVERARRMIAARLRRPYRITVSAGICDTKVGEDPSQLINLADGALYWSKAHGRNQCWVYDPAVIDELSAQQRAERLERSQAMLGLRALARAIDAKDPATRLHSERVAELVGRLALIAGWSPERARLLSEAALVHDVGKIGIPDNVLLKSGPLTTDEREQMRHHAELAAQIVEDVLVPEQVEWIRTHHERPDGRGYPRGLHGTEIPEGAALLAAADSWDVMTISRPYGLPKRADEALSECIELVGQQFTEAAVTALVALHTEGELPAAEPSGSPLMSGSARR